MDKLFGCDCGCGYVEISPWVEEDGTVLNVSFLKRIEGYRFLRKRIKQAWNLLVRGYCYGSDIVLSLETARELGEELLMLSKEKEK